MSYPVPVENAMPRLSSAVNSWFADHSRQLPWREPGVGAWAILVSEVMLQQTPVDRVVGPYTTWLERWPTASALASSSAGDAVRAWGRLGYPRRALRLHASAVAIRDAHDGEVPSDLADLLSLPGVGDYTARAVAAFAFGQRHAVVDTNVRRVLARAVDGQADAAPPSTRRDLAAMHAQLPAEDAAARVTNAAVMELGALVCTSRSPRCEKCPIADSCEWRRRGYPESDDPPRSRQPNFEGSDRQVRGLILAKLRGETGPVGKEVINTVWPVGAQLDRALASLLADRLVALAPVTGYQLPS